MGDRRRQRGRSLEDGVPRMWGDCEEETVGKDTVGVSILRVGGGQCWGWGREWGRTDNLHDVGDVLLDKVRVLEDIAIESLACNVG